MNVDLLHNVYEKTLSENEKNILFWENYLQNLEALDLNVFSEKLTVPVLVPIGSKILFRGELKHTNEVTVALGADYFAKCSVNQAEVLRQHRIKDAKSKLESLKKERDYLQNQLSFSKQAICDETGYDIIEVVTDEEDKNWRILHRENMRKYNLRKNKEESASVNEISNEELWNRLEELELQEELQNELDKYDGQTSRACPAKADAGTDGDGEVNIVMEEKHNGDNVNDANIANEVYLADHRNRSKIYPQPSKLQLFELVVKRHNDLKKLVAEIRARQRRSKTEADLMERLDDMEELEELEDEIALLEEMLALDDDDDIEVPEEVDNADNQPKKSVAFADEDDSETFEITFKHSDVEPSTAPYDPQQGITKPSDIYKAYPCLFNSQKTSILKKTKFDVSPVTSKTIPIVKEKQEKEKDEVNQDSSLNNSIVVGDVVEKVDVNDNTVNQNMRPMSLFKKRRQQLKE